MTSPAGHPGLELQDFLDGRLAEPDRARLIEHLAGCPQCRRDLEALRWVKQQAMGQLAAEEVPADLTSRVRAGLDAVDAKSRGSGLRYAGPPRLRWVLGGVLAAAALLLFVLVRTGPGELPERVARDFAAFNAGRVPLGVTAREPQAVERYFAEHGIGFKTRVYDLGMMRYDLLGGRVHHLAGRVSAFFVYRGADGQLVVCQMYQGRTAELPPPDETREHDGISFQVYHTGNTTVVFWQEGDVVCVLTSDAPSEAVIQLAFAKAVKV